VSKPGSKDILKLNDENRRLRAAVEELSILNDIATTISSTLTLEQIIDLIVQKCIKHLEVEQGAVMLLDEKEQDNEFKTMIRKANSSHEVLPFRLDTQLTGWMIAHKKPLLINDLAADDRISVGSEENIPFHSILSVPLCLKGKMIGSLNLFNKRSKNGFTDADKRLLTIIAAQSAHVIENARLSEEEKILQLMQEEMRLAYKIQMDLLPGVAPEIKGYDIAGKSIPAKTVGGDYFDFIRITPSCMCVCLGDVSGKGIPAALLMSNLQATLRGQVLQDRTPHSCIKKSNMLLFKSTDMDKFATLFYGVLNTETHEFHYCNAGHNYPFLIRANGETVRLDIGGLVLGALEDFSFEESTVQFMPGDLLVIFSDGISEATNSSDDMYGEERLERFVIENRDRNAADIIQAILDEVREHAELTPQSDDMTLVAMKRSP
jgi:sigma-B regulation protein RsbU (phosphoserine phosphatase)